MYRLQEANPLMQIQLETSIRRWDFRYYHNYDLAITYGDPIGSSGLHVEPLLQEVLYPVCSPGLLPGGLPLDAPSELSRFCLLYGSLDRSEWKAWAAMMKMSAPTSPMEQCFELEESAIQAAIAGSGISLVNVHFVREDLASGRLTIPITDVPPLPFQTYHMVSHPAKATLPALVTFKDWLKAEMTNFLDTPPFP